MGTNFVFIIFAVCATHAFGQLFESASQSPKGLTKSSLIFVSKTPSRSHDMRTTSEADQGNGDFTSFLTLLLLSSINDSVEKKTDDKRFLASAQDLHRSRGIFDYQGFNADPPLTEGSGNADDRKVILAMALQRLFGDSESDEELEENILTQLSNYKKNTVASTADLDKSQETLAKLIRQMAVGISSAENELDTFAYRDGQEVKQFNMSSEENRSLNTFAYRNEHGTKIDSFSSEIDDMDTFAFRDGFPFRKPNTSPEENKSLGMFAYRNEHGTRIDSFSSKNDDLDTFAYRDGFPFRKPNATPEENKSLDMFTYRDEHGTKIDSFSSENDDLDTFAYRDEKGTRIYNSSAKNDDLDTFAYRDHKGHVIRRFFGF